VGCIQLMIYCCLREVGWSGVRSYIGSNRSPLLRNENVVESREEVEWAVLLL
jgi:hypothetical protein